MKITTDSVESLVKRITYKPGWRFRTTGSDGYSYISVVIHWDVPETDPHNAPDYTEIQEYDNSANVTINVLDYANEVEVCRAILEECIAFERRALVHEAREFFRVQPEMRWDAPFHPHHGVNDDTHPDGMNGAINWRETGHRGQEDNKDLPQYQQS